MPRLIYRLLLTIGAALIFRFSLPQLGIYITYAQAIIATIIVQVVGFLLASDKAIQVALMPTSLLEMKDEDKPKEDE